MNLPFPLPPTQIRQGGGALRFDDDFFVKSAVEDVQMLESIGLESGAKFVDFGCGPGRLAIGLIVSGWEGSYFGVEVKDRHVRWATANITRHFPNFEFLRVDAANARYNPEGSEPRRFPVEDESVDFLCAFSVFSHLLSDDTKAYLQDIHRVLGPDGRAMITAYVGDDVPDETENPSWMGDWTGRLHCVLYERAYFMRMIADAGLVAEVIPRVRNQTGLQIRRMAD